MQFIDTKIEVDDQQTFATYVYAAPNIYRRSWLWPELLRIKNSRSDPWLVGVDLNCVARHEESFGGSVMHPLATNSNPGWTRHSC